MKFFIIPPLSALDLMHEGTAGYYCLANLYIKNENYREFFLKQKRDNRFILLDNGAAEHDLVTEEILLNIVEELKPNLVIPPDVLLDKEATIANFDLFQKKYIERNCHKHTSLFACPQGKTIFEWMDCYQYMRQSPYVARIGLSKIAIPYCWNRVSVGEDRLIKESRWSCVKDLDTYSMLSDIDIHCLGAGDMREFEYYKKYPEIVSTDSCNSVWSAMNGISFEDGDFTRIPTPRDYFERDISQEQRELALKNINWMKNNL